jgi:hypothetical protein
LESLTLSNLPKKKVKWDVSPLLLDYSKNGELENLETLIKVEGSSCDVNTKNSSGLSLLHLACSFGHKDVVQFLISKGADLTTKDDEGWSILHSLIAEIPEAETEKELEKDKLEPNTKTRKEFLDLLKLLLYRKEIDLDEVTDDGETLFDVVRESDDDDPDDEVLELIAKARKERGYEDKILTAFWNNEKSDVKVQETTSSASNIKPNFFLTVEPKSDNVSVQIKHLKSAISQEGEKPGSPQKRLFSSIQTSSSKDQHSNMQNMTRL